MSRYVYIQKQPLISPLCPWSEQAELEMDQLKIAVSRFLFKEK